MPSFIDKDGSQQNVALGIGVYKAAEDAGLSVPQYINQKYPTADSAKHGDTFSQMCASSGLLLASDRQFGIKSPSLSDVFSGKAMLGGFEAANVADSDPASRILYPAAVIAMIEDKLRVDREKDPAYFDQMVGNDISVNNARYEQPVISYTKAEAARSKAISQLAEPSRMLTITTTDVARSIPTTSIGLEISDQALQATTLDLVGMALQRYSEVERLAKTYDYLQAFLNGDTDHGQSALTQTKADTLDSTIVAAGAVTKKALLHWLWRKVYQRKIDWIVTDLAGAIAIEAALQTTTTNNFPIPGMVPNFSVMNRVFENLKVFVTDPDQSSWPADTLMGLDSRNAITRVTNLSAAYSAVEQFVLRRSSVLRLDQGEVCYRQFDDAFDTLSLTLTA